MYSRRFIEKSSANTKTMFVLAGGAVASELPSSPVPPPSVVGGVGGVGGASLGEASLLAVESFVALASSPDDEPASVLEQPAIA